MDFLKITFIAIFVVAWAMNLLNKPDEAVFYILVSIVCLLAMIEIHLSKKEN